MTSFYHVDIHALDSVERHVPKYAEIKNARIMINQHSRYSLEQKMNQMLDLYYLKIVVTKSKQVFCKTTLRKALQQRAPLNTLDVQNVVN